MDQALLTHLSEITEEEQAILSGSTQIQQELYTTDDSAVFDSHRLLAQNSSAPTHASSIFQSTGTITLK